MSDSDLSAPGRQPATAFSIATAHALVSDLLTPSRWIFWTDFILTTSVAYAAGWFYLTAPDFSVLQIGALLVTAFSLFRTATFIHEIVHLRRGTVPGFTLAWNLLVGIPMGMPSSFYANHADHHSKVDFGTPQDGEYLPFAHSSRWHIVLYFLQIPVIPLFAIIRFLVLTPLSLLSPPLRRIVEERASSYVSNPYYRKEPGRLVPPRIFLLAEFAIFLLHASIAALLVTGVLPLSFLLKIYILAMFGIALNWLRNLGGHRFDGTGAPMSHAEQFKDSITIEGHPLLTELLFPLGLRYHAIHHLFPGMPYHSLGIAHRRFMADLPREFGYHDTLYPSLWWVLKRLWHEAGKGHDETAMRRWKHHEVVPAR